MNIKSNYPINEFINFDLSMIYNSETLNIFSDASMRPRKKRVLDSAYGAVAVNMDTIIDKEIRINSECTVPAAELRGIRTAISLAFKYRNYYKTINIFSDSQISLLGLRDYIYKWKIGNDGLLRNTLGIVKNQELFLECFYMLEELKKTNYVNLYHQKGHIDNDINDIQDALVTFKKSNHIPGKIDYNTIRYISVYNNYIDAETRTVIRRTNIYNNYYQDPIKFSIIPMYYN